MSSDAPPRRWIYRYPAVVRLSHWVNVLGLAILSMSGLQIFNAHPALYWGHDSHFETPLVSISAFRDEEGRPIGVTRILDASFNTTGLLGWSRVNGRPTPRAFPAWLTIPGVQDLATGRVWHFFFAWVFVINGLVYVGFAVASRHALQTLLPQPDEWRTVGRTIRDHVALRLRHGDGASYNVLQKLAYWKGPQLSRVLNQARLGPEARFIVFHCADELPQYTNGATPFYESIDLVDAFHPQTILAYEMNGTPLTVPHGAPLRLRLERQLGYKMAKFLTRIEVVDRFDQIGGGRGGTWEDDGYEWYAGI